jgi:hypothetical protein
MDWTAAWTIIGINVGLIGILATLIVWATNKHEAEIRSLGNRLDGHASRIDQLYQIIVDMLKEKR